MSFQFSPETLAFEIDNQIQLLENQIAMNQESITSAFVRVESLKQQMTSAAPRISITLQNMINAIFSKMGKTQSVTADLQNQISDFIKQKELLLKEAEIRDLQRIQFDQGIAEPPTQPITQLTTQLSQLISQLKSQQIPQTTTEQGLPLKELALIGGAVLLLA